MAKGKYCYTRIFFVIAWVVLAPMCAFADDETHRFYFMEVGVQGGAAYYVGELAPYVFMSTAEVYGAQARVKIDYRWAIQLKGQRQRVVNAIKEGNEYGVGPGVYKYPMWHLDLVGEYNFFQLGLNEYNIHMRALTPYMFAGVGMTIHDLEAKKKSIAVYIPVGLGVKWKFAERWQLQFSWQHNLYVWDGDGLEGVILDKEGKVIFNDSYGMNGSNIMNNDLTSSITLGIVFEFGRKEHKCVHCNF